MRSNKMRSHIELQWYSRTTALWNGQRMLKGGYYWRVDAQLLIPPSFPLLPALPQSSLLARRRGGEMKEGFGLQSNPPRKR